MPRAPPLLIAVMDAVEGGNKGDVLSRPKPFLRHNAVQGPGEVFGEVLQPLPPHGRNEDGDDPDIGIVILEEWDDAFHGMFGGLRLVADDEVLLPQPAQDLFPERGDGNGTAWSRPRLEGIKDDLVIEAESPGDVTDAEKDDVPCLDIGERVDVDRGRVDVVVVGAEGGDEPRAVVEAVFPLNSLDVGGFPLRFVKLRDMRSLLWFNLY